MQKTALIAVSPGESAFFVSKELALDQVFGDGPEVHRKKNLFLAVTGLVNGPGDQFFPGSRFAVEDHVHIGDRRL